MSVGGVRAGKQKAQEQTQDQTRAAVRIQKVFRGFSQRCQNALQADNNLPEDNKRKARRLFFLIESVETELYAEFKDYCINELSKIGKSEDFVEGKGIHDHFKIICEGIKSEKIACVEEYDKQAVSDDFLRALHCIYKYLQDRSFFSDITSQFKHKLDKQYSEEQRKVLEGHSKDLVVLSGAYQDVQTEVAQLKATQREVEASLQEKVAQLEAAHRAREARQERLANQGSGGQGQIKDRQGSEKGRKGPVKAVAFYRVKARVVPIENGQEQGSGEASKRAVKAKAKAVYTVKGKKVVTVESTSKKDKTVVQTHNVKADPKSKRSCDSRKRLAFADWKTIHLKSQDQGGQIKPIFVTEPEPEPELEQKPNPSRRKLASEFLGGGYALELKRTPDSSPQRRSQRTPQCTGTFFRTSSQRTPRLSAQTTPKSAQTTTKSAKTTPNSAQTTTNWINGLRDGQ